MTAKILDPNYIIARVAKRGPGDYVAHGHVDAEGVARVRAEGHGATWDAALADLLQKLGLEL